MKSWNLVLPLALGGALAAVVCCSGGSSGDGDGDTGEPAYTRQSMINACVRMHSCGIFQLTHVHNCVVNYESREVVPTGKKALYRGLHTCVNKAKGDCTAIRQCFGARAGDPECDSKYTAACDGDVRRFCDLLDRRIYRVDCSKGSLKCGLDQKGSPFCGAGPCKDPKQRECRDKETRFVYCQGQGLAVEQCDWIGLKCGYDRDKQLGCVAKGKKCAG